MIFTLLQFSQEPIQPDRISYALELTLEGRTDSALSIINESITDQSLQDSTYYQARYLQAWILKQQSTSESLQQSLDLLETNYKSAPEKYYLLRSRMHALAGNIKELFGDLAGHLEEHTRSYELAVAANDTSAITLALRNLYGNHSRRESSKDELAWFVDELERFAKKTDDKLLDLRALMIRAYYEHKYGDTDKAIRLIASARPIALEQGLKWYEDVQFARVTFFLGDGNFTLAESVLFELLNEPTVQASPSARYKALARLVQLYMFTDQQAAADRAWKELNLISGQLHPDAIELGVYARMAYRKVGNPYELDPVFKGVKKSGYSGWALAVLCLIMFGATLTLLRRSKPVAPAQVSSGVWQQYSL